MVKSFINRNIRYVLLNQLFRLMYGPILLLLIPKFLTGEEQGYWFTITSLAALVTLADLGFSNIILQFAAHEFAFLHHDENNSISGSKENLLKLSSLFKFTLKWVTGIVLLVFPCIMLISFFVLSSKHTLVSWGFPWLIFNVASILILFNNTILAFIEGCDSVGDTHKIRLLSAFVLTLIIFPLLVGNFKIYSLAIAYLVSAIVGFFIIFYRYGNMLRILLYQAKLLNYNWRQRIIPLISRYSVSWISGYIIFQLFTPIAFSSYGSIMAGKVGISLALWMAAFSLSNSWMVSVTPQINILISMGNYPELNRLFIRNLFLSILTYLLGVVVFWIIYFVLKTNLYLVFLDRFVGIKGMIFLSSAWFFQLIINAMALYMRSHKEEPLMVISFVSALYVIITTYGMSKFYGFDYYFCGYFSSTILVLPIVFVLFLEYYNQRKQYQAIKEK